jgi:hypothetical protein
MCVLVSRKLLNLKTRFILKEGKYDSKEQKQEGK